MTSTPDGERGGSRHRRAYIDWARAVAVLLMIEAHAVDAWTRPADRGSAGFRDATILGGFAAPLFLWLAGVSLVLSAESITRKGQARASAVNKVVTRGLEILVLAYLFRIQAFVISPGNSLLKLFRVDILNVMGPAIAAAALLWGVSASPRVLVILYSAVAGGIAMVTPIMRVTPLVDLLPTWMQWYVRPAGEYTTFTLFPWAGFVFAGAAVGTLLAPAREVARERRLNLVFALVGAALIAIGFYATTQPTLYRQSSFWTSSPTYFTIRIGAMMVALAAIYGLAVGAEHAGIRIRALERFGRHSLFVYWIHVELVYGYASWLWRRRLPLWGTAAAYMAFVAAMYGAVMLEERIVGAWRARGPRSPAPQTATA